ncbi:hypothetical protein [Leeuwenhoekiella sp. H156]
MFFLKGYSADFKTATYVPAFPKPDWGQAGFRESGLFLQIAFNDS